MKTSFFGLSIMAVMVAAAGLAAFCFATDRIVLGGINSALAVINAIMFARL